MLYPCRVLGFRKRAQSAEEESSASLQHLTLTEFLKEYVFTKMASQPCMCGLTHPNPVVKPFPNLSINHMDSLQLYLVMCQPSAVDYINAFYVRSQFRFKVTLHVSLSLRSHFCLSPRICNVTSISCCQYLTHY